MKYPQIIEYNEALQHPQTAFLDPELQRGRVTQTPLGLPRALSGGFALTYEVACQGKTYAVRCFHREVSSVKQRYQAISSALNSLSSPYFVDFDFQGDGIRVAGSSFPIVKMKWASGNTLSVFISKNIKNKQYYVILREKFRNLASFLEANNIAHGDVQNENVIVDDSCNVTLIDYDGMFVTGLQEGDGNEFGHKHFQHPDRSVKDFGPRMDRFSFIIMDISLETLSENPSLFQMYGEGGQAIILKAPDYNDPENSEALAKISSISTSLAGSAGKLKAICASRIEQVPSLEDFLIGKGIPTPTINLRASQSRPYIGVFPVLDAADFDAVLRMVGQKVELVGQVVSIKEGVGKSGNGKGKKYVFINFGYWRGDCVSVTIWSEGLSPLAITPNQSWVGKWLSLSGLIEPPYIGKHFGRAHKSVGPTISNAAEISIITEADARFRLGRTTRIARSRTGQTPNQKIFETLQTGGRATPIGQRTPSTANVHVLNAIRGTGRPVQQRTTFSTQTTKPAAGSASRPATSNKSPMWGLIVFFLIVLVTAANNQFKRTSTPALPEHEMSKAACERRSGQTCQMFGGTWWSERQYKGSWTPTVKPLETNADHSKSKKACEEWSGQVCTNYGGIWWSPSQYRWKQEPINQQSEVPRLFQVGPKGIDNILADK